MKNIAIFYASNTGNTKEIAKQISKSLDGIKEYDLKVTGCEYMQDYENIILGVSTWDEGKMQDDWEKVWSEFLNIDFKNKKVAIFGLGNQKRYKNNFLDAMGKIYLQLIKANAQVIGFTSTLGYEFENSEAVIKNSFVGLAIDIENDEKYLEKIENWTKVLKNEFK
ncbi:flavodoxin [Arcobacter sp. CECT 8989]|uniref:flavodoxin n=1 Tax=Arcobacter sp. CECT 8989 TaxID=2044509 RepID=UPI00100BBBE6|nr:flavodoxin [Arcobacter sp. CECT 8989]RXK00732.1 flavodoxin [Arcobacter sp. CECT 8989]